jgi:hypothetical protein
MAPGSGHDEFSAMLKGYFLRLPGRYGGLQGVVFHNNHDFFPKTPPSALICSTATLMAFTQRSPTSWKGPER